MIQLLCPAFNEVESLPALHLLTQQLLGAGIVHQVAVADGGSSDGTPDAAEAMGLRVVRSDRFPGLDPVVQGKGDNLWRALRCLELQDDDVVVLLDADVALHEPLRIRSLIETLEGDVQLVKADFDRVNESGIPSELRGGRVTEFTARPLLAQVDPHLAALGQPLSGQIACRYGSLRRWPAYSHYAYEIGMLIAAARAGVVAEAHLGALVNADRREGHLNQVAADVVDGFFAACCGNLRVGSRVQLLPGDG